MRIAIYSDNFYPEMSGISDSIITIGKSLVARGHEVNFYVPFYAKKDFETSKLKHTELDLGSRIRIIRLFSLPYPPAPTNQGRMVLPILSSYRHIRKFDPDVIYTQLFFGAGLEALMVSRLLKKPLIGTSHTPIAEFLAYAPVQWGWIKRLGFWYVNWYYGKCTLTTAPSQGILTEMQATGFHGETLALSNPVELAHFQPVSGERKAELKKKFHFSGETVLYTGRIAEEKHIDVIIRAIAKVKESIPDISLAITGHGSHETALQLLVKELGLEQQVHFLGYLDEASFTEVYQAADMFAVMSTAETQCLSMMHAMATGIPVLGADARALPEYIREDNGFVIPVGDAGALAEKITFLCTHPLERDRLGRGGYQYVKNFSVAHIVDEWEGIFQEFSGENAMRKMKLSFVIPAYNEEKVLGKCLESVLREARDAICDIEILVVNNASTDRTDEVARSFSGVRVVDEPRKGLVRARQAGYEASSGDLIANVDADTILPKGWIDRVIREFASNQHLVALSGPYYYHDLSPFLNWWVRAFYRLGKGVSVIHTLVTGRSGTMLQGGNFILRRRALERAGGFNLRFDFYGEDTAIAKRMSEEGEVKFTFALPMYTSGRRLQAEGIFRMTGKYAMNFLWVIFFHKPYTQGNRDIRV